MNADTNKERILEIANQQGENESNWVDYKEDYHIGGIAKKRAEFIRDICSLANTQSPESPRYILIGFDDQGQLVGVSEDADEYPGGGPKHIFCFDDSDIQEIINDNISPPPRIDYNRYSDDGRQFASIAVYPPDKPPCIVLNDIYDSQSNRLLHEGLIFTRTGSSKKIAKHEDIESIIQSRVDQRREDILENIEQVISVGPDALETLGATIAKDGVPVEKSQDADLEFDERITRTPASTLDAQLNEDISQWAGRGDDFVENLALWEYYTQPKKLTLDFQSILFLTQSSIKHEAYGTYWLSHLGEDFEESVREILLETKSKNPRIERACVVASSLGRRNLVENIVEETRNGRKTRRIDNIISHSELVPENRIRELSSSTKHNLNYESHEFDIDLLALDMDTIGEMIPDIGKGLYQIQSELNGSDYGGISLMGSRTDFKNALQDMEVALGVRLSESNDSI